MRMLAALLAVAAVSATPAAATEVDALAERLREDPVLVDPRSAIRIDEDAVLRAAQAAPVPMYFLVLPQGDVDRDDSGIDGVLLRVVDALDEPRAVVVVVTDSGEIQAGEGGASGVPASALLDGIVQARDEGAFNGQALTAALVEFAEAAARNGSEGAERGITGSGRRTIGFTGLVAVAVIAAGLLWVRSQRQVRREAPRPDAQASGGSW